MSNGFGDGGGFSFGDLFSGLLGTLLGAIEAIVAFLNALVQVLVGALNFLFAGEVAIFGFSFAGLDSVFHSLKGILDKIFKQVVLAGLTHLLDLYRKLQAWAKRLKAWLDRFHALQKKYQVAAFRRAINLIQRIRKILVVFRIFHLKFATKLDNLLVGIEGRLIRREADIARKTNEIIGWVNLIADPTTLFRQVPLLRSIGRGLRDMLGAVDALGIKNLFPKQLEQALGPGVTARPWSQVVAQFHAEVGDTSGDYGGAHRQALQFRELLDRGFSTARTR
jgi:hypothetical protein